MDYPKSTSNLKARKGGKTTGQQKGVVEWAGDKSHSSAYNDMRAGRSTSKAKTPMKADESRLRTSGGTTHQWSDLDERLYQKEKKRRGMD